MRACIPGGHAGQTSDWPDKPLGVASSSISANYLFFIWVIYCMQILA